MQTSIGKFQTKVFLFGPVGAFDASCVPPASIPLKKLNINEKQI